MGMFDNISVADKLPISQEMIDAGFGENNMGFQTKCLHRCLDTYIIQGGKLFQLVKRLEERLNDEQEWDLLSTNTTLEELPNYHGVINFYTSETRDKLRFWIEYEATFTRGKLDSIVLKEFRIEDDSERQKMLDDLFAEGRIAREKWYNKYCLHTKSWRKIRSFIHARLYDLERLIQKIRFNLP